MKIYNVLFLAANTARSQGYAQALLNAGFKFRSAVLINKPGQIAQGQIKEDTIINKINSSQDDLFYPDFSIPLRSSLGELVQKVDVVDSGTTNDNSIIEIINELKPDLVIYSGFGGEIVKPGVLALGPRLLHIHSGYLPKYRGSTTVYYSILNEYRCGVSAILLRNKIDVGEIVKRIWFDPPSKEVDIDYSYDVAIRASTLVQVLDEWKENKNFPCIEEQTIDEGETYFVIHPLLKHLAIMSLE
jgi:methionyl-tRNA formyltransferase